MKLVIVGGGTGGHVTPGIAVARELLKREKGSRVLMVGTSSGIEADMVPQSGLPFEAVPAAALRRSLSPRNLLLPFILWKGLWASLRLLRREEPDAVLATGGYVSVPMGVAAWIRGIPLVIHESNAIPGLANRFLGRLAKKVCVSYPPAPGQGAFNAGGKAVLTGNPVRVAAGSKLPPKARARKKFGLHPARATLLVFPGSRAAHPINLALGAALKELVPLERKLQILWMTGLRDYTQAVRTARYFPLKISVQSFIQDVAGAYACADLVLARAGASTLAEITALGIPSVLVPYPFATGDHQSANAGSLKKAGAAVVVENSALNGESLAKCLKELLSDSRALRRMAAAAKKLGRPQAAAEVLKVLKGVACV